MIIKKNKQTKVCGKVVAMLLLVTLTAPTFAQNRRGDGGGNGKSIAIVAPRAVGLSADLDYLPVLIQGELVSNFTAFSSIDVLDRQNHEAQLLELMDEMYSDRAREHLRIGNLTHTDYLMDGTITRIATGYNLQIRILRISDQTTVASYSGTSSFLELENLTSVRRASAELLERMGVTLTSQARNTLTGAVPSNRARGQRALAQGIVAQRQGTEVAALSYFYQAAAFDPSLVEAIGRSEIMAADISSGRTRNISLESARPNLERTRPNIQRTQSSNIGENIRNEIQRHRDSVAREEAWRRDSITQVNAWRRDSTAIVNAWRKDSTERDNAWRRDWVARLKETEDVFHNLISSATPPYSLHYATDIHTSNINYRAETADLGIFARVEANTEWFDAMQQALRTVQSVMNGLNATGRKNDWGLERWPVRGVSSNNPFNKNWWHDIRAAFELVDERGRVIGRESVVFNPYFNISQNFTIAIPENVNRAITFNAVKADDISDNLTIRIARINGKRPENAQILINVITGEREIATARHERERALAEEARLQAQAREWWMFGTFGVGGDFLLGNIDTVYSGGAFIFGGSAEFFQKRLRAIRIGGGFDLGFIAVDRDVVKNEHPTEKPDAIDEATIMAYMARAGVYVKLQPVNVFYLSGGVGYGSYGQYYGSGAGMNAVKGGDGRTEPILSVGAGIILGDFSGGLVLDVQYHMLQFDSSNGHIAVKIGIGVASNLSSPR